MSAFGSAKIISPSIAKLAVTPPVVGSVRTVIYNNPASLCRFNAADVFAICISEVIPSCILAPPEQVKIITGSFSFVARSTPLAIFSPTTSPILAMRNLPSITIRATSFSPIRAFPVITASSSFVFSCRDLILSGYPIICRGFSVIRPVSHSSKESFSVKNSILFWAGIRR